MLLIRNWYVDIQELLELMGATVSQDLSAVVDGILESSKRTRWCVESHELLKLMGATVSQDLSTVVDGILESTNWARWCIELNLFLKVEISIIHI